MELSASLAETESSAAEVIEVEPAAAGAALAGDGALVLLSARHEVLERRARGQRVGLGPLERLVAELPGAQRSLDQLEAERAAPIVHVDNSNVLDPRID